MPGVPREKEARPEARVAAMSAGELEGACGAGFAVLSLGILLVGALMEAVEGAVLAAVLLVLGMARRAGAAAEEEPAEKGAHFEEAR